MPNLLGDSLISSSLSESNSVLARFDFSAARRDLLEWFDAYGRKFPWRDNPTPYRVWISEIMLQQTTTQTVVGYFERFLARFPDVVSLAEANEETVLKYWEGLGYYRRARALRAAAVSIVQRFNGVFPNRYEDVLSLPGVGKYATGAILSFGFNLPFPILEVNTTRLHSRLLALREDTTTTNSQRLLWKFADVWLYEDKKDKTNVVPNYFRRLNGALMDLGRLICTPKEPRCVDCPLEKYCEGRRLNLQGLLPVLRKKKEIVKRTDVAFWITRGDLEKNCPRQNRTDVLLILRPAGVLWAGLWDFPRFEILDPRFRDASRLFNDINLSDRLQFFLSDQRLSKDGDFRADDVLTTFTHSVTRYRVSLRLSRIVDASSENYVQKRPYLFDEQEMINATTPGELALEKDACKVEELRWVGVDRLEEYPLSSPGRKIARFIENFTRTE